MRLGKAYLSALDVWPCERFSSDSDLPFDLMKSPAAPHALLPSKSPYEDETVGCAGMPVPGRLSQAQELSRCRHLWIGRHVNLLIGYCVTCAETSTVLVKVC